MIFQPRDYQQTAFDNARTALSKQRSVLLQLPTGAGKMWIAAMVLSAAAKKHSTAWFVAHRSELLNQCSEKLDNLGVSHARIDAKNQESDKHRIFVISKDTLMRRLEKIKNKPDLIIFDEAHLNIKAQEEIAGIFPDARIIGLTATPERLDGIGLSTVYDSMTIGPSIEDLTARGYLSRLVCFCPPDLSGELNSIARHGTEYQADELEKLLQKKHVYGKAVEQYTKHTHGLPALAFCRNVQAAKDTARLFQDAGFDFHCVDGTMKETSRKALVDGLTRGRIQGLTNVNIATTGLDIPRVEVGIFLRPTLSLALYYQMVGRIMRIHGDTNTAHMLDHANLMREHGPVWVPRDWNFYGDKRKPRKNQDDEISPRCCPELDFMYCVKPSCVGCEHNTTGRKSNIEAIIDVQLERIEQPVKLSDRSEHERKEIKSRIETAFQECHIEIKADRYDPAGPLADLFKLYKATSQNPMGAYYRLAPGALNKDLLRFIQQSYGYKKYWIKLTCDKIRVRLMKSKGRKL